MATKLDRVWRIGLAAVCLALDPIGSHAQPVADPRIEQLIDENRRLRDQLQEQQRQIESLLRGLEEIQQTDRRRSQELDGLRARIEGADPSPSFAGRALDQVILSGEGGLALFHTGPAGQFPNSEFRVDEAKVFLEAPIWKNVYFFSELDLVSREREAADEFFHLGELYLDFENVSSLWGKDHWLSVRAGRFDIPFGEEYQHRDVIANPLISHSLGDLWGVDEGIGLYGSIGRVQYVTAVQNGGHPTLRDFDSDKSITGRIGYDATEWLRLSFSGMRTGNLDVERDRMSEIWFGNGFVRALGPPETTTHFAADLFELDAAGRWNSGHVKAILGYVRYNDNDTEADNRRDVYYYSVEGKQDLWERLYGAARFSQILAEDGFPVVGHGSFGRYFFGPLTEDLWRLSLGMGYSFSPNLVLKAEYTLERGRLLNGARRNDHDFFGTEIGFRF